MDLPSKVWWANEIRIWGTLVTALVGVISFAAIWAHSRWQTELVTIKEELAAKERQLSDERIATAQSEAASANERAAQARLEQERIKSLLAWRRLDENQSRVIADNFRGISVPFVLRAIGSDPESMLFAQDIQRALANAGINVELNSALVFSDRPVTGIKISGSEENVRRLAQGFLAAGFNIEGNLHPTETVILVGSKPPP